MNRRGNILKRLRRWQTGAARCIVGSFFVAYLAAGVAPCAMAASRVTEDMGAGGRAHVDVAPVSYAAHDHRHADNAPAPADHRSEHCPHCFSGTAIAHGDDHSSCLAFEDLTNVAASHAKDAPQPLAPSFGPAAFTLPPSLASPRIPPLRAAEVPPVPLNVRHCVFLI